ncbi:MAG: 1-acyl-sn-glycerol-3-phosphate acyltransferase [Acholeplasmataceae bacterium]|jgi:1-acyl-sn-glycerol-3-phosphate acyltransferase|nr:1-acyl-sn-glycerol-3-phosphate acyltransferase [Acholeplasmataceae bacterium]
MRKKKETKWRHLFIVNIARLFLAKFMRRSYNYESKRHRELKRQGPFLILGNHTVAIDPLLMSLSFPFHIYYIATEQIFNLGFLSKLLKFAVNPIKKSKSVNDIVAIRKARKIVSEGGSIGVYPEGNLTYDGQTSQFGISVIKLIRLLKIPVIFFVTEGLYLSNPRWAVNKKRGRSKGYLKSILEPEDYNKLNDEQLYQHVYNELYVNAYQQDPKIPFKGQDLALGLERLIFIDLLTDEPFQNYTVGDMLYSRSSEFSLKYLEDGYLLDQNNNKLTLIELNERVIKSFFAYYKKTQQMDFTTSIFLERTIKNKKKKYGKATLTLKKDSFLVKKKTNSVLTMNFADIGSIAIQGKKKLIVYHKDDTWLFVLDQNISPYAYFLTYQFYKKGELLDEQNLSVSDFGL